MWVPSKSCRRFKWSSCHCRWRDDAAETNVKKRKSPLKGYVCPKSGIEIEPVLRKRIRYLSVPFISKFGLSVGYFSCRLQSKRVLFEQPLLVYYQTTRILTWFEVNIINVTYKYTVVISFSPFKL